VSKSYCWQSLVLLTRESATFFIDDELGEKFAEQLNRCGTYRLLIGDKVSQHALRKANWDRSHHHLTAELLLNREMLMAVLDSYSRAVSVWYARRELRELLGGSV